MYKELIKTIALFIAKPVKAWEYINTKNPTENNPLHSYAYPLMGLGSLSAFIVALVNNGSNDGFQIALKEASLLFISSFIGLYTAAFLIRIFYEKYCKEPLSFDVTIQFVVYSSSVIFIINLFNQVTSSIFFLQIFSLYTIYIVWEGSIHFLKIEESKRASFVLFSAFCMILLPIAITALMKFFMPGLQ
ncbi:MAG: DUF1282 family protein [Paludibacteraceae bacterium]|jgi:hypothetical protein|nr:DUF1282 family protein [Paludibacteraceae bacterium]NLK92003.1 YIP1 family protein [Bacteroidales bacterium]MBP7219438.1 DUF1282 family protein [Paludibacteraceae bacterium]MBP8627763.1 DUF1282 family protein [Paludibacteraceae bacterium]MBP8782173.1 DUF1282 family protein [Paludibacteraceae bacterium]